MNTYRVKYRLLGRKAFYMDTPATSEADAYLRAMKALPLHARIVNVLLWEGKIGGFPVFAPKS